MKIGMFEWICNIAKRVYLFGTTRIVCGAGSIKRYSARLSVCLSVRLSAREWVYCGKPSTAGLLLLAGRAGDIDPLLKQWRAAG